MTRRTALLLPISAYAQSRFPGVAYPDYSDCLPAYLRRLASDAYLRRTRALSQLTTPAAIKTRQKWVRQTLTQIIGAFPDKTPLNPHVMGSFERAGYRVEKVIYESRPRFFVSANLYIPTTGTGPFPGVLFQMGHTDNGKAGETYQSACQGLAKLGFVVLGFDPIGQGERIYYPNQSGVRTRLKDTDEEHSYPGRQMLLAGWTCTQMQLWDAVRSLDYLASLPIVDTKRLASTGQSGGATLTMLLAAVDDRLKAAAVFSGNTENVAAKNFLPPGPTDDAEQDLVNSGPVAFDRWDLLYPIAPKPLLISISDKDFFGTYSPNYVTDSWNEYQRLKKVYAALGAAEKLSFADTPLPHGLSYDSRLTMYKWFIAQFMPGRETIHEEPAISPESEETLRVCASGNLVHSLGGETPFSLLRKRSETVSQSRTAQKLDQLLNAALPASIKPAILKSVPSHLGVSIDAINIATPDVSIPAWIFRPPASAQKKSLVVLLNPRGRNSDWHEGQLCHSLANKGFIVCAADVRGIGDLAPGFSPGAASYEGGHGDEESYAWSSLILGRPLVGQRAADVVALVRGLRVLLGKDADRIGVAALGKMTVPAVFSAALERSIQRLYLANGLISFRSITETENYQHPLANFVPNVLAHTDIPEIVKSLAPVRVALAGGLDGGYSPVTPEIMRKEYGSSGRTEHIDFRESPDWTAAAIAEFFA